MKFITDLNALQKSVNKLMMILPQKSTIPVLEHFYFWLEGNTLKIIASDRDVTLMTVTEVESSEDGKVLIPGKRLSDLIKSYSSNQKVEIKVNFENFDVTIKIGDGKFKLKGLDAEEYSSIPDLFETERPDLSNLEQENNLIDGTKFIYITKDELGKLCNKTFFAVSDDEYRPAMTGVLFQFRETHINAVATDSYRLARSTVRFEKLNKINDSDVILPSKSIDFLRKIDEDEILLSMIETQGKTTHLRFDIGNTIFVSKVIEERFPPYEQVIPKDNPYILIVDRSLLLNKLKPLGSLVNKKVNQIKMLIANNQLSLMFNDDETGSTGMEVLNCEFNKDSFELAYNMKFLEDAISNIGENDTTDNLIKITFSEPNRPTLILPNTENDDLLMLVMPVRI